MSRQIYKADRVKRSVLIKLKRLGERVVSDIENGIFPPKPYTLIHSRSLSFRYSILRYILNNTGYQYMDNSRIGIVSSLQISRRRLGIE